MVVSNRLLVSLKRAGDDATDEGFFARLPGERTIHVGRNQSRARYYLSKPDDMVALLAQLVASRPAPAIPKSNPFTSRLAQKSLTAELD